MARLAREYKNANVVYLYEKLNEYYSLANFNINTYNFNYYLLFFSITIIKLHKFLITNGNDTTIDNLFHDIIEIDKNLNQTKELVDKRIESLKITNPNFDASKFASEQHEILYKLKTKFEDEEFSNWPTPLNYTLSFYKLICGDKWFKVQNLLKRLNINANTGWVEGYTVLKEVSAYIKASNYNYDPDWIFLIDLHLLYGFNLGVTLTPEEVNKKCETWGKGILESSRQFKPFLKIFKESLRKILFTRKEAERQDLDVWLSNPDNWVTSGSSRGIKTTVFDVKDKINRESDGKKIVYAVKNSVEDIKEKLLTKQNDVYTTALKIEPGGKGRLIISAPFINNIRMARLSGLVEKMCVYPGVPIFNTTTQTDKHYQTGVNYLNQGFWALPLDASSFDQTVATDELECVFDVLSEVVDKYSKDLEYDKQLMQLIREEYFCLIKTPTSTFKWEHGVPSGIRWTTFIDTLVSLSRALTVKYALETYCSNYNINELWSLGDDLNFWSKTRYDCVTIVWWYKYFGLPININKNFASNKIAEFLRNVFLKDGVFGYPARKVVSILFDKPGSQKNDKIEKLTEIVDNINVLTTRFISEEIVLKIIHNEMALRFGPQSKHLLTTPVTEGGLFGLDESISNDWLTIKYINKSRRFVYDGKFGAYVHKLQNSTNIAPTIINDVRYLLADAMVPPGYTNMTDLDYKIVELNKYNLIFTNDDNVVTPTKWVEFRLKQLNIFDGLVISYICENYSANVARLLLEPMMAEDVRETELWFWNKATRSVWFKWIKGDYKLVTPTVVGYSKQQISRTVKVISSAYFTMLKRQANVGKISERDMKNFLFNVYFKTRILYVSKKFLKLSY